MAEVITGPSGGPGDEPDLTAELDAAEAIVLHGAGVETVTVICTRHRRRVASGSGKGTGIIVLHTGPGRGNVEPVCDSGTFGVRREQQVGREAAHAELLRLDMTRQAQAAPEEDR